MRYLFTLLILSFAHIHAASNDEEWLPRTNLNFQKSSQLPLDDMDFSSDGTSELYSSQSSLEGEYATNYIPADSPDPYRTPSKLKKRKTRSPSSNNHKKENISPNRQDIQKSPFAKRRKLLIDQQSGHESTPSTPKTPSSRKTAESDQFNNMGTPYTPNTLNAFESNGMGQTKRATARVLSAIQYGASGSPYSVGVLKEKASKIAQKPITDDEVALKIVFEEQLRQPWKEVEKFKKRPKIKSRKHKRGVITSEAVSAVGVKRTDKNNLLKKKVITETTAKDYVEPYVPESPSKIAERKSIFQQIYLDQEKERGITPENLSETYDTEKSLWHKYFEALKKYKLLVEQKSNPKLTKLSLEAIFDEYIALRYSKMSFGYYKIFYARDFIDLNRKDREGRPNSDRLESGLCPIGHDGKEMHFHHFTLHDYATHGANYGFSYVVLVSHEFHSEMSGLLHPNKDYYRSVPATRVDRPLWGKERTKICMELYKIFNLTLKK